KARRRQGRRSREGEGASANQFGVEAEEYGQDVIREPARQRSEGTRLSGGFHGAQRFLIEQEVTGAPHEAQVGNGAVPIDLEENFRGMAPGVIRLEAHGDLTNDVVEVTLIRKVDPAELHVG